MFAFFTGFPGSSYYPDARDLEEEVLFIELPGSSNIRDFSLERLLRSLSEVEDKPELIKLLQQIFVFDPLRRPEVSDVLDHPWFTGSSSSAAPTEASVERQGPTGCLVC